jgi:5' nucleotidase, deoxy (Pyrimidine), cytosolic type C protein (NT5C)
VPDFLIGLDLDGVVYQWDKTARYMIRRRIVDRGEIPPEELSMPSKSWSWIEDYAPKQDWDWLWSEAISQGLYRYGHVESGAIEGVRELNQLGDVVAITARPKEAVHDTLAWLTLMLDKSPLAGVVIQSNGQKKSEVTPTPDVYIDDGIHNFDDVLANTKSNVVQFMQPWNLEYLPAIGYWDRHFVAGSWRDTVELVRCIKAYPQREKS